MHIVSASRRTDIPAFHADWFMNRIRAGKATVLTPFGGGYQEVSLAADDVIAIVFWTKNAQPLLKYLSELSERGFYYSFLYTVNNYPDFLEPLVPKLSPTMKVIEELATKVEGPLIRWRYDTIVMTEELNLRWHVKNFEKLCRCLAPFSSRCIFSFCDYYRKTRRNMAFHVPDFVEPTLSEQQGAANELAEIAGKYGISFESCAHDALVKGPIQKGRCIDPDWLSYLIKSQERRSELSELKMRPSRKDCACIASKDIGAYDTCKHGCIYCYANANLEIARRNVSLIDREASCLTPRSAMKAQA